jgi:4-amino-4-deoxy-L-arabinose transferase-like glycosyltransferase
MNGPSRSFVWTLCLTYVWLAVLYNALTPIGEAPDELDHAAYVRVIVEERRLPGAGDALWQGHQAPLYYLLQAAWGGLIRASSGCRLDRDRLPGRINREFPHSPNFNRLVHEGTEQFPSWQCAEWSFHLLRLLSTALTVPMILLTLGILREVVPGAPATAAVGVLFAALLPSHVFITAMLNNDALVNALVVAATYLVIRASRSGEPAELAGAVVLAAIATTAKLSGLFLFGLALLALVVSRDLRARLLRWERGRPWLAAAGLSVVLPVLVLARNLAEWGDLFAVGALEKNFTKLIADGATPASSTVLQYYAVELPELFANGWAVAFGAVNFRFEGRFEIARWISRAIVAGLLLSAFFREAWKPVRRIPLLILIVGLALFLLTYGYPGYRYRWLQVRYFFNQLPILSLITAIGILTLWQGVKKLVPGPPDRVLVVLVYVGLVGLNLLVLTHGVIGHLGRYVGAGVR